MREAPSPLPRETPPRASARGIVMWLVAAVSLVIGIGIGFATGYRAGGRQAEAAPIPQAFSEAAVMEPVPVAAAPVVVDPEPVVVDAPANPSNPSNPSTGSIDVLSRPSGAQVVLDGRVVGRTPLSIPDVAAGAHSVRLELPTYNRWATTIDVAGGTRARVAASLEQTP